MARRGEGAPVSAAAAWWDDLVRAGLVRGAMPPAAPDGVPWYVATMVGTAAWIAALFLLGFIGAALASIIRDAGSALAVGAMLTIAAVASLRLHRGGLFFRQLAVAVSLAGQALVLFGLTDQHWREPLSWAGVALFEGALVAATPEPAHRVLAALAGLVALRIAMITAGLSWLAAPLLVAFMLGLHLACVRMPRREALWSPLWAAVGLVVLALLPLTLVDSVFWYGKHAEVAPSLAQAGTALVGIAWLAVVAAAVRTAGIALRPRAIVLIAAGALIVAACAWRIPMVVVALALLLVAFAGGRPVLAGIAVLAVLAALAHGYYSLQASLLAKAGALAATGAVLLLASASVRFVREPGGDDA